MTEACQSFDAADPTVSLDEIPFFPLADLLAERSRPEEARKYEALAVANAQKMVATTGWNWWTQATHLRSVRRYRAYEYIGVVMEDLAVKGTPGVSLAHLRHASRAFRFVGRYARADQHLAMSVERSREADERYDLGWLLANRGRVRYNVHDFAGAEPYLRQAVEVAHQSKALDAHDEIWLRHELAMILNELGKTDAGKRQEAQALYRGVAEQIAQLEDEEVAVLGAGDEGDLNQAIKYVALLLAGEPVDHDEVVEAFHGAGKQPAKLTFSGALVLGLSHASRGEGDQAIPALEAAARKKNSWIFIGGDTNYLGWIEERLLDLYIQQGDLERANEFFTDLVESRDKWLPPTRPMARSLGFCWPAP